MRLLCVRIDCKRLIDQQRRRDPTYLGVAFEARLHVRRNARWKQSQFATAIAADLFINSTNLCNGLALHCQRQGIVDYRRYHDQSRR